MLKGLKLLVLLSAIIAALPVAAGAQQKSEFLLVWVFSGDYIDSGLRFSAAGGCYAEAQNKGMEMREIGLKPPQFFCVPLAEDQPFVVMRQPQTGSRFPF